MTSEYYYTYSYNTQPQEELERIAQEHESYMMSSGEDDYSGDECYLED